MLTQGMADLRPDMACWVQNRGGRHVAGPELRSRLAFFCVFSFLFSLDKAMFLEEVLEKSDS